MQPDKNQTDTTANAEDETEAAGGEDIYGADGDAGTARPDDQEAANSASGTADNSGGATAADGKENTDAASAPS